MTRSAAHFAGILGWPLEQTLSPIMHNAAFRKLGIDWVYLRFPVPPESLGAAVAGLRTLGARGANVTMPHKEAAIDHLDALSGDAERLGAVNTIQEVGGRLVGHNTDVDGFTGFLIADAGLQVEGKTALVLGAGGAARAIVKSLDDLGAAAIRVACRDEAKGAAVAEIASRTSLIGWGEAPDHVGRCDLIVNATPLGSRGEDALPDAVFRPGQAVVDIVYGPGNTPLVTRARAAGAEAWGGLGMLVHQAVASFRIWTGQDPPANVMSAAAIHELGGIRHKRDGGHSS